MKNFLVALLLFAIGCQHTEQNSRNMQNEKRNKNSEAGDSLEATHGQIHESTTSPSEITHKVNTETPYYESGPQQARAADGFLAAGTKVKLLEAAGSYALVITETGIKGYVLVNDLEQLGARK